MSVALEHFLELAQCQLSIGIYVMSFLARGGITTNLPLSRREDLEVRFVCISHSYAFLESAQCQQSNYICHVF